MRLVDANVLLYAVDATAGRHGEAKAWLDRALSGGETVVLPWICLLAFVRLSTHPAVYPHPLSTAQAMAVVKSWTRRPNVVFGQPGREHAEAMERLLASMGTGGNLVNDAHIAALAIAHGATVVTYDNDFGRFPGVRWETPA